MTLKTSIFVLLLALLSCCAVGDHKVRIPSIRDTLSVEDRTLFEEFQLAYDPRARLNDNLQRTLETSVFELLDRDTDGFIDCEELGIIYSRYSGEVSSKLANRRGEIHKDVVLDLISYPAPAREDESDQNCAYEQFLVNTNPEDLWVNYFGRFSVVDMDDLSENLFNALDGQCREADTRLSREDFSKPTLRRDMGESEEIGREMVFLGHYTQFRNEKCRDFVPSPSLRRKLSWESWGFTAGTLLVGAGAVFSAPVVAGGLVIAPWVLAAFTATHNNCNYFSNVGRWYATEGLALSYGAGQIFAEEKVTQWFHDSEDEIWHGQKRGCDGLGSGELIGSIGRRKL